MTLCSLRNPFCYNPHLGFFLQVIPYAFTVVVLFVGSCQAIRKRKGALAALDSPFAREER